MILETVMMVRSALADVNNGVNAQIQAMTILPGHNRPSTSMQILSSENSDLVASQEMELPTPSIVITAPLGAKLTGEVSCNIRDAVNLMITITYIDRFSSQQEGWQNGAYVCRAIQGAIYSGLTSQLGSAGLLNAIQIETLNAITIYQPNEKWGEGTVGGVVVLDLYVRDYNPTGRLTPTFNNAPPLGPFTPGVYGDASHNLELGIDAFGRITSIAVAPDSGGGGTVQNFNWTTGAGALHGGFTIPVASVTLITSPGFTGPETSYFLPSLIDGVVLGQTYKFVRNEIPSPATPPWVLHLLPVVSGFGGYTTTDKMVGTPATINGHACSWSLIGAYDWVDLLATDGGSGTINWVPTDSSTMRTLEFTVPANLGANQNSVIIGRFVPPAGKGNIRDITIMGVGISAGNLTVTISGSTGMNQSWVVNTAAPNLYQMSPPYPWNIGNSGNQVAQGTVSVSTDASFVGTQPSCVTIRFW